MLLIEFILRQDLGLRFMIGRIFLFTGDGPFCWDGSQVIKSGCLLYRLGEVSFFLAHRAKRARQANESSTLTKSQEKETARSLYTVQQAFQVASNVNLEYLGLFTVPE